MTERRLPPVTQLGMLSLALIVTGGIYLASNLGGDVSLTPAYVLLLLSAGLVVLNLVLILRVPDFDREQFVAVGRWALLAYAITAGLIEYAFVRNHVTGGALVVLTLSLVVYAVHVPMLIAFTVARYADPPGGLTSGDPGRAGQRPRADRSAGSSSE